MTKIFVVHALALAVFCAISAKADMPNDTSEKEQLKPGQIAVDFNALNGKIRKELYGSGLHIFVHGRKSKDFSETFKTLRFPMVRNHDWSLNNPNQRMIDVHHIFPLMHLDPSDERNYYFAPSDEVIRLVYEAGSKVFYRLGTSIEHTKDVHFNANPPEDFEKYAEVCAGIIRHYTKGWNKGFKYDMPYWEIWNEPEGHNNMWTGTDEQFAEFFAIVLKRLKSEFPELKIGGPANCGFNTKYIDLLKAECDKLGVKPDFYSFHMYGASQETVEYFANEPRKYLDKIGWTGVETCLNEWHFVRGWSGIPYERLIYGKDGRHGINSAVFNIISFCIFQKSPLDSAYYYGCGTGTWGVARPDGSLNKNYYSLLMMRDMVYDFPNMAEISCGGDTTRVLAGISDDGKSAAVLAGDLYGIKMELKLSVKGFDNPSSVTCMRLDHENDNSVIELKADDNGIYHLMKIEPGSAAFMVVFKK